MDGFFGFPTWNQYLPERCYQTVNDETICETTIENIGDFWLIGASLLEMIIRLAAIVAVGLFIFNGAKMMASQGSPDRVASARDGMLKATIGLVITLLSANIVAFLASAFSGTETDQGIPIADTDESAVQNIIQYVFAIIGAAAVLIVIIAGIRYIVSAGDPQRAATSKNAIIYAIVGLVIAVSAYLIVEVIFNIIDDGSTPGSSGQTIFEAVASLPVITGGNT